jgi:hypothetical protein
MKEIFSVIAALLAVVGNFPYLRDTLRQKTEPHAYTWLVWTLVSGVTFFGQIAAGAGVGALPTGVAWVCTFAIFLFSLRTGLKHLTFLDTVFLLLALLGIIPWFLTDDPTLSVVVAVLIDLAAFVPTIRKTWRHPASETSALYSINVARHILTLLSLEAYNVATMLHSVAMILANALMTVIIFVRRQKNTT